MRYRFTHRRMSEAMAQVVAAPPTNDRRTLSSDVQGGSGCEGP